MDFNFHHLKRQVNKPEDAGKCIKESRKASGFGKVNELHFSSIASAWQLFSYIPTVSKEASSESRRNFSSRSFFQ
jgi:hypothetical protein